MPVQSICANMLMRYRVSTGFAAWLTARDAAEVHIRKREREKERQRALGSSLNLPDRVAILLPSDFYRSHRSHRYIDRAPLLQIPQGLSHCYEPRSHFASIESTDFPVAQCVGTAREKEKGGLIRKSLPSKLRRTFPRKTRRTAASS